MHLEPFTGHRIDGSFVVAEWSHAEDEAGIRMAPVHRHHSCDEAWMVLEGNLGFLLDGEEFIVGVGGMMFVPRGATHTFWNAGPGTVRYVIIMTPKTAALIDAIHAASDRSEPALRQLFADHDAEFIGWDQPQ